MVGSGRHFINEGGEAQLTFGGDVIDDILQEEYDMCFQVIKGLLFQERNYLDGVGYYGFNKFFSTLGLNRR